MDIGLGLNRNSHLSSPDYPTTERASSLGQKKPDSCVGHCKATFDDVTPFTTGANRKKLFEKKENHRIG